MPQARIVRRGEGETYLGDALRFKHGSLTGGRFDFIIGEIGYLVGPPLHVHRDQDDTFFVIDGVLTVQAGDDVFELMPGDFASIPPGVAHTFDNTRKDQPPVKVINLMTPGGLDSLFQDMELFRAAARDPAKADELWDRHGARIVGPTLREKLGLHS